jgi:uncharacterized protein
MNSSFAPRHARGRSWSVWLIFLLLGLSVAGWFRLRVDSSLEPLLPEKSEARQTVLFLRDSSFASKIILWFRLKGDGGDLSQLYTAADEVEKRLDPGLITRVVHPPVEADAVDQVLGLLDHAGELLNEKDLIEVDKSTAPAALSKRMRECYMQLLQPQGSFMQNLMRKDPLGINARILSRLYSLSQGMGYRVEVKNGRFVHSDGRELMMVLETSTSATSLANSQRLVNELNQLVATAPRGIEIIPIGAQLHTVENQKLMQADTRFAGAINGVVFLLLFLLVSRDWRVASIFLLPLLSIGITIGLCALVYPSLSLMVIGIALTMAGSAVDYGIFVYTAVTSSKDRQADLRRIRIPLLISHLTTLGVFLAFLFSTIPAYRQLGWLTSISLVLSLLAALFVLPRLIKPGGRIFLLGSGMPLRKWGRLMVPVTVALCVLMLVGLFLARKTNFNADLTQLDGVTPAIRKNEADFQKTWARSDADMGLIIASGQSRAQADQVNDKICALLSDHFKPGEFISLASFWPSAVTRVSNQARWSAYWTPDRIERFKTDLATAGEPYGFSTDAFQPFFDNFAHPALEDSTQQIVSAIEDQFVARSGNTYQLMSFFPDTAENVRKVRDLLHDETDAQIISRRALGDAFASSAFSETRLLVAISAGFIIVFLLALTRNLLKSFLIMLPALTGLIAMLAVLALAGCSMNMVTVVASIAVLALASDYGVFAIYAWENHEPLIGQGMASIHLCALTTVTGTAALIFARHPALYLVGISLTSGLLGGYLTALFVIPGLCYLLDKRRQSAEGSQ